MIDLFKIRLKPKQTLELTQDYICVTPGLPDEPVVVTYKDVLIGKLTEYMPLPEATHIRSLRYDRPVEITLRKSTVSSHYKNLLQVLTLHTSGLIVEQRVRESMQMCTLDSGRVAATRTQLGEYSDCSREMVSRVICQMQANGELKPRNAYWIEWA